MRIFLTGGTGVIGTRALPALVAAGHDVTAVARSDPKTELVLSLGGTPAAVDLFDPESVAAAVAGHEVVMHLATSIPSLSRSALTSSWETNERLRREASTNLVDAALEAGAACYLQESICFPYQDNGDQWIGEDHPVEHVGPFAGAGFAEAAARRFAADGRAGVVLRFGQLYAADSSHTQAASAAVRRHMNPFLGRPDSYTSFIHAQDAGSAAVAGLDAASGIYNVVDDEPVTRADAGRIVAAALGVKPPHAVPKVFQAASPASAKLLMRSLRVSHARFTAATGWRPAHRSIRDGWPTGKAG